jgi:hypothetical protein
MGPCRACIGHNRTKRPATFATIIAKYSRWEQEQCSPLQTTVSPEVLTKNLRELPQELTIEAYWENLSD